MTDTETSKHFPTLAVLSVTTGRLLTKPKQESEGNGIGQLYKLLGWMTDDEPFTHQLPRFARECKPWILRWHPNLADVEQEICERCDEGFVEQVQADMIARLGETIELWKMPKGGHEEINPIEELLSMRGVK